MKVNAVQASKRVVWRVERSGMYRFSAYDALMNALEARGMGALFILDYGHPDHGGSVPRTAEDLAAFGRRGQMPRNLQLCCARGCLRSTGLIRRRRW
jgi:hypothetical protein